MRATINIYKYNDNEFLCIDEITELNSEYHDYSKVGIASFDTIYNSNDSAFSKAIKTSNLKHQIEVIGNLLIELEEALITIYNSSEKQIATHHHNFIIKPFVHDIVNTNILINYDNKCYISLKNLQKCNIWGCKYYKYNEEIYERVNKIINNMSVFDIKYNFLLIID